MACQLASSYDFSAGCQASIGGVDKVYIMEFANVSSVTVTANVVTAVTKVATKVYRTYNLAKEMGSDSDNLARNVATASMLYDHKVDFTTNGITTAMKQELKAMAQTPLSVIVLRRDGTAWMYGKQKGMDLVVGNMQNAKEASNGPQMVWGFTGQEPDVALEVQFSVLATLLS